MATKKADKKFRYPVLSKLVNAIRSLPNSNMKDNTMTKECFPC